MTAEAHHDAPRRGASSFRALLRRSLGLALLAAAALGSGCAASDDRGREHAPPPAVAAELRAELLAMAERDQTIRSVDFGALTDDERRAAFEEWGSIDTANTARLADIVALYGWPEASWAGEDGAHAAWLLVQHADGDPAFQARCLPLIEDAVRRGEADASDFAYLSDRVRVAEGRPQLYGTQYGTALDAEGNTVHDVDGNVVYAPPLVVDAARLDERRRAFGLGPWREYDALVAKLQGRAPFAAPRDAGPKSE